MITVRFFFLTGIKRRLFRNARLGGTWNDWAELPMGEVVAEDGCPAFTAEVQFDDSEARRQVRWGVRLDGPQGPNSWGINLEASDPASPDRHREFELPGAGAHHEERYHFSSLRTAKAAVNDAPLVEATRDVAEARCRMACGLSMLSAATPMFLMGEEIVAQKPVRYDKVAESKDDLFGERAGAGARMFRFYQDLIRLRRGNRALRSRQPRRRPRPRLQQSDRLYQKGQQLRRAGRRQPQQPPVLHGYVIETASERLPDGLWRETFNSNSSRYGGSDVGNSGGSIPASHGRIDVRLPANGFLVLQRLV